jgi:anti-anti-sigma factor
MNPETVRIEGDLDLATRGRLERVLAETGDGDVCLDLTACTFVDSSGLMTIVGTAERMLREGKQLFVKGLTGDVARIFDLTHLIYPGSAVRMIDEHDASDC